LERGFFCIILGLGLKGSMYQLFNGANPEDYRGTISTKGEVIYPDTLEELKERLNLFL
jgi:hypothetical protein